MRTSVFSVALLAIFTSGCATTQSVRYVYQDKNFGVIGMPENTNRWPNHYHREAEKLMGEHFPLGYEIVRAEEVTEGSRTLKIEGSKTAEISPEIPAEILKIAKFGRTATRSQADVVKIKECRIIYRRSSRAEENAFSSDPDCVPTRYLDPNESERKKPETKPQDVSITSSRKKEGLVRKPASRQHPHSPFFQTALFKKRRHVGNDGHRRSISRSAARSVSTSARAKASPAPCR